MKNNVKQGLANPVRMRLYGADPQPGEQVLRNSALFREQGLHLLKNVRYSDLRWNGQGRNPHERQKADFLYDYLVCKESVALLAVSLQESREDYGEPCTLMGLPLLKSTAEDFAQGKVNLILEKTRDVLKGTLGRPDWRCPMRVCFGDVQDILIRERLVEWKPGQSLVPTEYGVHMGISQKLQGNVSRAVCTYQTVMLLRERFQKQEGEKLPSGHTPSFEERVQACQAGRFLDDQEAAQLVKDVMNAPLQEYLFGFPQRQKRMETYLPGRHSTWGEAARGISDLLKHSDPEMRDMAITLMLDLVCPLLADDKVLRVWGGPQAVAACYPQYPLERYQRLRGGDWEDISTGPTPQKTSYLTQKLQSQPMVGFFQGVGTLTRDSYPGWLAQTLLGQLELKGRCRYVDVLWMAIDRLGERKDQAGGKLLYLLAVEPFCLLQNDRNAKFRKTNNDHNDERKVPNNEV